MLCDYRLIFSYDLQMCSCPLGNYVVIHPMRLKEEKETNVRIVLIVSSDDELQDRVSRYLGRIGTSYVSETESTRALVKLLDNGVKLMIVDIDSDMMNGMNFLHAVCTLRPGLPVLAMTDERSEDLYKRLTDEGVKYILVKQFNTQELSRVVELQV